MLKKLFTTLTKDQYLLILVIVSAVLRFLNLGYSDYQGDEIKALFNPDQGQSVYTFLLDQRKGPMQFLVTYLIKLFDPTYSNELFARLPFAIAGLLAVIFFYKLVSSMFDKKIGFYSAFFLATNGFFVAFSRIVQYQSFVILFMVLALYFLYLAVNDEKYRVKGLYLGLLCWSFSILSHYDGFFIAPFVFYLLIMWFKDKKLDKIKKIKVFILSGIIPTILLLAFYVPFALNISQSTQEYWMGRLTGDVSAKISSSRYLFGVYNPIYVVHLYTLLFVFGTLLFISSFVRNRFKAYVDKKNLSKVFSPYISGLFLHTNDKSILAALCAWLSLPVLFWELYVYVPGTHIYTYLIPMFIILAFGMLLCEKAVNLIVRIEYRKVLNFSWVFVFFIFLAVQSYFVFVDNAQEYPWEPKKFLLWTLPRPLPTFHLSLFGFPYNRNWEGIRDFVNSKPEVTGYTTNERESISRFYIHLNKGSDLAGFYIQIAYPQSINENFLSEKAALWAQKHDPVYTYSRHGKTLVSIYEMPVGTLEQFLLNDY